MTYDHIKLCGKIAYMEDLLLRSNNRYEIKRLREVLVQLRKSEQKMQLESTQRGEF